MKPTCNERGGIFVELTIVLAIMFTFYSGTISIHRAAARRFKAIIEQRNSAIEKVRGKSSPQLLPRR